MSKTLLEKIKEYGKSIKEDAIYKRTFLILASIVIVFTLYQLMLPAITISQELICEKEEHTHTEECYKEVYICGEEVDGTDNSDSDPSSKEDESCYEKVLSCEKEEHTHQEDTCYAYISKEAQALINEINEIPTVDELNTEIEKMYEEDKTAEEMEIYYNDVIDKVKIIYEKYNNLEEEEKVLVTNIDKIEAYYDEGLVSEEQQVQTYVVRNGNNLTFDIFHQNTYKWDGNYDGHENTFGYTATETTLGDILNKNDYGTVFYPFYIIVAKKQSDNTYRIYETYDYLGLTYDGTNLKEDIVVPANSIVFLVSKEQNTTDYNALLEAKKGAKITLNLKNSITTAKSSTTSLGTITVTSGNGTKKTQNDNSSKLNPFSGENTRNLITVNLYNYKSNINTNYNSNKYYPGFQQPGGTTVAHSLSLTDLDNFNFGDTIADEYKKSKIYVKGESVGINTLSTTSIANRPVTGHMYNMLYNGYPAVLDQANDNNPLSLKYLFSQNTYADKLNTLSIDKLFQRGTNGEYYYDSRVNHAQFNSDTDEFILYKEKITANYIQYPFGNFLPLNDIVHETTQASLSGSSRISQIIDYARYKANTTSNTSLKAKYEQLYLTLINYDNLMTHKSGSYVSSWTAGEGTRSFFDAVSIQSTPTAAQLNEELKNIYNIDYDEATNFFFGLEMKMNFIQPKNGLTGTDGKQPMEFYFTGDDDVWVYIDDILFLDLSGIHRHVGGEIDFVNGKVYYYELSKSTGDVSTTPYETVTFETILEEAGKTTAEISAILNSKGTFNNYSTHDFNFYYMERGSGSGVMRMNFNMPLIEDNAITINKELTAEDDTKLLGNPDFKFQILKPDGSLFVGANKEYSIYNDSGLKIGTSVTDANGIITLKAGQHAVIAGIPENSGNYYVMELLDNDWVAQYGEIKVDGSTVTNDSKTNVEIGSDTFTGVKSPEQNISDGNTTFNFNNIVDENKYGSLQISKKLVNSSLVDTEFIFKVTLDGVALESGVTYKLCSVTRSGSNVSVVSDSCVNKETTLYEDSSGNTYGVIKLKKDQVAILENIYGGSKFTVEEVGSLNGFDVTYSGSNITVNNGIASGNVLIESTVSIDTINTEKEKADIEIPVTKELVNYDGSARSYTFKLIKLDSTTSTILEEITIQIPKGSTATDGVVSVTEYFSKIYYSQPQHPDATTIYNYRIIEVVPSDKDLNTKYDTDYIDVEVTVINNSSGFRAEITDIDKSGVDTDSIKFTNKLLGQLSIGKTVINLDGSDVNLNEKFDFKITLDECTTKEYITNNGTISFNDSCEATIQLGHGDVLTIYGLSPGIKYTISEVANGYAATNTVNGTTIEGSVAPETEINVGENSVQFINKKGYLLPETGSFWMIIIGIIGALLLATPVIYIGYSFYKKERSVT